MTAPQAAPQQTQVNLRQLLEEMIQREASDLHISASCEPVIRVDGQLIRLNYEKFDGKADPVTLRFYDDDRTNIIVVGRTIPNKKLEHCLGAFSYYQKYLNPKSRLIFVGMWNGFEPYYFSLREQIHRLGLREVIFTGHILFEELVAFYRLADVLIAMSEHEGFCVPILEAFYMNVPVLAWEACAVPYTAGVGGVMVTGEKDYSQIGEMLHRLCTDSQLRFAVIEAQQLQLKRDQEFPFEQTLLDSLNRLKSLPPVYPSDIEAPSAIPN